MQKSEFLEQLYRALKDLPAQEVNGRLQYYSEMIDDRMEDGMTEEESVAEVGSVEEIAQLLQDADTTKPEPKQKEKRSPLQLTLLIVGAPVWGSLLIAAAAVVFSLYAAAWAVVISLYAVSLALGLGAIATIPVSIVSALNLLGICFMAGIGLTCAGLAVLLFFGTLYSTKQLVRLTKWGANRLRKKVPEK